MTSHLSFDRCVKRDYENPTIGIILCRKKNAALVEITLPKDTNIHASEYQLYLPSKDELRQKLMDWSKEAEVNDDGDIADKSGTSAVGAKKRPKGTSSLNA